MFLTKTGQSLCLHSPRPLAKMVSQTATPMHLLLGPSKDALRNEFVGKSLDGIRTPALVIDRSLFAKNCAGMHQRAEEWGASFRAHLKTHKVCIRCRVQRLSIVHDTIVKSDIRGIKITTCLRPGPFSCCSRINITGGLVSC